MNLLSGISNNLDLVIDCRAKFYNEFIKINKCPACDGTTFSEQLYSYHCAKNNTTCVSCDIVLNKNNSYDCRFIFRIKHLSYYGGSMFFILRLNEFENKIYMPSDYNRIYICDYNYEIIDNKFINRIKDMIVFI